MEATPTATGVSSPRASTPPTARKVLILTGGGDAPGLNAVLRAFVKRATSHGIQVLGSEDGFAGLLEDRPRIRTLDVAAVRGILPRGGSILGCSNLANPFEYPVGPKGKQTYEDRSARVAERLHELGVETLVLVGGDGTMSMGLRFQELGIPVVGIPKTIDNDLDATDFTFGLDTAVDTATWAIDALHSTAESHDRVMILELMGRHAGWIALCAGVAGGADVILIPEIPYDVERVAAKIRERSAAGSTFSIVVVGEGAFPAGGAISTLTKGRKGHLPRLGGAGQHLAALLDGKCDHEIRVTVLGHVQRGGSPSSFDRLLGTRFGVKAADLCAEGRTGRLVALRGTVIRSVPLEEAVAKAKLVPPDGELATAARAVGIELGG
ncbi:MAG: ATP-dependent 6-phosphofructokinase [Sandaracinus sp.]|nr:ATP-dependent 6-phosphofructokinase [Sandaracinus sp.]